MHLQQIDLKNFGSFRDASIRLAGIAAAVVLGPNGAGKSTAFIDAILWALYGEARSATDDMIRTGETDMAVSLIFDLAGQRYRVTRKRSTKTKAGKSDLELQLWGPDGWTPISGARLADTQQKILQLLNADRSLLTATAFFVQGQADRFSKATASERKVILASILRLDRYADLKQAATRQVTRLEDQRADRGERLADLEPVAQTLQTERELLTTLEQETQEERRRHEALEARRRELVETVATLKAQLAASEQLARQVQEQEDRLTALDARAQQLTRLHASLTEDLTAVQQIARDEQAIEQLTRLIAGLETTDATIAQEEDALKLKLAQADTITARLAEDQKREADLKARAETVGAKHDRWQKIITNKPTIDAKVQEAARRRDTIATLEQQLEYRERDIQTTTHQIDQATAQLAALKDLEAHKADAARLIEQACQHYRRETEAIEKAIIQDKTQTILLGQVPCDAGLQARCQFTLKAVEAQQRIPTSAAALRARLTDDQAIAAQTAPDQVAAVARLTQEIDALAQTEWVGTPEDLRAARHTLQRDQERDRVEISAHRAAQLALEPFLTLVPELQMAEREIDGLRRELWSISEEAAKVGTAIAEAQQALTDVPALRREQEELALERTLNRQDRLAHQTSIQSATLAIGQRQQQVQHAKEELPRIAGELATVLADQAALADRLKAQRLELQTAEGTKTQLVDVHRKLGLLESTTTESLQRLQRQSEQQGQRTSTIQALERDLAALQTLREEVGALDQDLTHYRALAAAYAIIPTLVMENAVPILEQETNALLARISRTGMRARFDTQRALKSRDGLAETMDIVVRDQIGERPIENYSGGERFRLDVAIRVGLSKLLARRAGSRIETLAIDEGLGSLDEDGLQQLRECLGALGDDFKLLLVITHVDAMKATFPSQIMVTGSPAGSQVEVLA